MGRQRQPAGAKLNAADVVALADQFRHLATATQRIIDQHDAEVEKRADRDIKLTKIEGDINLARVESKAAYAEVSKDVKAVEGKITELKAAVDVRDAQGDVFGRRVLDLEHWKGEQEKTAGKRDRFKTAIGLSIIGACGTLAVSGIIALVTFLFKINAVLPVTPALYQQQQPPKYVQPANPPS